MVGDSEYGGCRKTVTCCFASSSWTSTEQCAGTFSCSSSHVLMHESSGRLQLIELHSENPSCSGACLQLLPLGWILCEQFQIYWKTVQVFPCILTCPVMVSSFLAMKVISRPPLWSSGQSSWLQIRKPGFDSRHYQKRKSSGSGTGCTQPREYNWGAT
jgi:hypothetical protein